MALLGKAILLGILLLVTPAKRIQSFSPEDLGWRSRAKPAALAAPTTAKENARPSTAATWKANAAPKWAKQDWDAKREREWAARATAQFLLGDMVVAQGLTEAAQLNGQTGMIQGVDKDKSRYFVNFGVRHGEKLLKADNLDFTAAFLFEAERRKAEPVENERAEAEQRKARNHLGPFLGKVYFYHASQHYGFITADDTNENVFFHLAGGDAPIKKGDRITFDTEDSVHRPGERQAYNVARSATKDDRQAKAEQKKVAQAEPDQAEEGLRKAEQKKAEAEPDQAGAEQRKAAEAASAAALTETGAKVVVADATALSAKVAAKEVEPGLVENPALNHGWIYVAKHDGLQVFESCGSTHIVGYLKQGQQVATTDDAPCSIATIDFLPIDTPAGVGGYVQLSHLQDIDSYVAMQEKAAEAARASALTEEGAKVAVAAAAAPAAEVAAKEVAPVVDFAALSVHEIYVAKHDGLQVYESCGSTHIVGYLKQGQQVTTTDDAPCSIATTNFLSIDAPDDVGGYVQLSHLQKLDSYVGMHQKADAAEAAGASALTEAGAKVVVADAAAPAAKKAAKEVVPVVDIGNLPVSMHETYIAMHEGLTVWDACGSTQIVGYLKKGELVSTSGDPLCTIATTAYLPIDTPRGVGGVVQLSHLQIAGAYDDA